MCSDCSKCEKCGKAMSCTDSYTVNGLTVCEECAISMESQNSPSQPCGGEK